MCCCVLTSGFRTQSTWRNVDGFLQSCLEFCVWMLLQSWIIVTKGCWRLLICTKLKNFESKNQGWDHLLARVIILNFWARKWVLLFAFVFLAFPIFSLQNSSGFLNFTIAEILSNSQFYENFFIDWLWQGGNFVQLSKLVLMIYFDGTMHIEHVQPY